jgi:hypothetical protein
VKVLCGGGGSACFRVDALSIGPDDQFNRSDGSEGGVAMTAAVHWHDALTQVEWSMYSSWLFLTWSGWLQSQISFSHVGRMSTVHIGPL